MAHRVMGIYICGHTQVESVGNNIGGTSYPVYHTLHHNNCGIPATLTPPDQGHLDQLTQLEGSMINLWNLRVLPLLNRYSQIHLPNDERREVLGLVRYTVLQRRPNRLLEGMREYLDFVGFESLVEQATLHSMDAQYRLIFNYCLERARFSEDRARRFVDSLEERIVDLEGRWNLFQARNQAPVHPQLVGQPAVAPNQIAAVPPVPSTVQTQGAGQGPAPFPGMNPLAPAFAPVVHPSVLGPAPNPIPAHGPLIPAGAPSQGPAPFPGMHPLAPGVIPGFRPLAPVAGPDTTSAQGPLLPAQGPAQGPAPHYRPLAPAPGPGAISAQLPLLPAPGATPGFNPSAPTPNPQALPSIDQMVPHHYTVGEATSPAIIDDEQTDRLLSQMTRDLARDSRDFRDRDNQP